MSDRPATVDTVIFDLDGTLVDSVLHHALAWHRAFLSVGLDVPTFRIQRHIGMGGDRLVGAVAGDDVERRHGDRVREAWENEYDEMMDEPVLLPGARELLAAMKERGLTVVLASSSIPKHAHRPFELLDAERLADETLTGDDAEESKPHPELLEVALERADADSSLLVGDSVWDVEAARHLGIPTCGLLSGGYSQDELRSAGAGWVFEDPADLLAHLDQVLSPATELTRSG